MSQLKVGVIGLGNMGKHHARNYFEMPQAHLVAVMDVRSAIADEFALAYHCHSYTTVADMLANETLDAVTITVPTHLHFEIASQVIAAGVSVLIEKPIADTVEDAQRLIDLAKAKGVILMVGHIERFNPAVTQLKALIEAGKLGQLTTISARRVGVFPAQIKDANVIIDLAVHDIDVMSYLFDREPDRIVGSAGRALVQDREDYADILLTYGNQHGLLQVNWITPVRIRGLTVTGTKGYAELNYMTQELTFYESQLTHTQDALGDPAIKFGDPIRHDIKIEKQEQLRLELSHFLDCVATGKSPLVSGEVGLMALKHALLVQASF